MADRVDIFLGQTVLRLSFLNGYLSSVVLQSAASEIDGVSTEQPTPLLSCETGHCQPGAPVGRPERGVGSNYHLLTNGEKPSLDPTPS